MQKQCRKVISCTAFIHVCMLLLYIKIDIQSVQAFRDFMFLNRRAAEIAVKAVRKVGEWQSRKAN